MTLLSLSSADPDLSQLLQAASASGALVAHTSDPEQAQRWLDTLAPDLLLTEASLFARLRTPTCPVLNWTGDARQTRHQLQAWLPALQSSAVVTVLGDVEADLQLGVVRHRTPDGLRRQAAVPAQELRLMIALMRRAGRVVSRGELLDSVWPVHAKPLPRTVDQTVRRLRVGLQPLGLAERLRSLRGLGYRFDPL
ncbi:DNA-binding response OmpR family regulator [Inhella inkyongensis]|uniref:DNA-binding response OmpR family regulator n=1 Tax=Inhella inkyongensis TaxID=392593 RepID=A0A840S5V3_9BURK|nr:winged helix-turn-helix domain-containing protein [Inhella inkyongensis]MBB5203869.1 DNA-binding response OmpR family regulator [Inhella inkyongensis]